jgi:hypothetical protein
MNAYPGRVKLPWSLCYWEWSHVRFVPSETFGNGDPELHPVPRIMANQRVWVRTGQLIQQSSALLKLSGRRRLETMNWSQPRERQLTFWSNRHLPNPRTRLNWPHFGNPNRVWIQLKTIWKFKFLSADLDRLESHAPQLFHSPATKAMRRCHRILLKSFPKYRSTLEFDSERLAITIFSSFEQHHFILLS